MKEDNTMHDEYKIFLLSEGELTGKEKEEMLQHLMECKECWTKYESYTGLKLKTRNYYSLVYPERHKAAYWFIKNRRTVVFSTLFLILVLSIVFYRSSEIPVNPNYQQKAFSSSKNDTLEYDIFDTQTWNQQMYMMEMNIQTLKQEITEKPL